MNNRHYFAANVDTTGESILKSVDDGEIKRKLGENAKMLSLKETPKQVSTPTEGKSEISPKLLIAAAILMLLEIPLANKRRI